MSDKDDECMVCEGTGRYPIFDKHGTERFNITCPACDGSRLNERAEKAANEKSAWQLKYDAAMAEKQARQ